MVVLHGLTGRLRARELPLPGLGTVAGFQRPARPTAETFFELQLVHRADLGLAPHAARRRDAAPCGGPTLRFDPDDFVTEQVLLPEQGRHARADVPGAPRDMRPDGDRPVLLYGYGGFDIALTPGFSAPLIPLLERGGVFAQPNLRGGGEYGEAWHEAGMLERKQNVFDDFIAAAEWLIEQRLDAAGAPRDPRRAATAACWWAPR